MRLELSVVYIRLSGSPTRLFIILPQHLNDRQFRGFRNKVRYRKRCAWCGD